MSYIKFIQITPEQLQDTITETLKTQLDELKKNFQIKEPTNYVSRADLAKKFSVDASTIHNWRKRNLIVGYQLGGRIFFKLDEVESAIVELKQ